MFALAGLFLALLGITVSCIGTYQAIRLKKGKTLVEGLVLLALAVLMLWLSHGTSTD